MLKVPEQTISEPSSVSALEKLEAAVRDALTVAMVADSLDEAGACNQVMAAGLSPLATGTRFMGRAATVQFARTETAGTDPYRGAIDFVDALRPGSVAVIATSGDPRSAYWGELFSCAARGRRCAGTVCDGPVRDIAKIRAMNYPVVAPSSRPIDFRSRMRVVGSDVAVRCAGVHVDPGDMVFADDDGVVVVPRRLEHDVLSRAVSRATTESSVREDLVGGAGLGDVWARWGVL